MAEKVLQGDEGIREAVVRARPMSALPDNRFFRQGVAKIEGVLIDLNEEVLPNFPLNKEKIAKEFSLFVDWSGKKAEMDLQGLYSHGRVLTLNLKFVDKYGNTYNYIAVKGGGIPERTEVAEIRKAPIKKADSYDRRGGAWGLQEYVGAKAEWDASNELLANGIQTSVPIAIIRIDSVILNGERRTVKELKEMGVIPKTIDYDGKTYDYQPVIYLVGFSEFMREKDALRDDYEQFAKEHGMKLQEYVKWWSDRLAVNIAKLHNLGKVHGYLNDHNITLDGLFVDNDGVKDADKDEKTTRAKEMNHVMFQIPSFFAETRENERTAVDITKCRMDFLSKYLDNRPNMKRQEFMDLIYELRGLEDEVKLVEDAYERKFGGKVG